MRSATPLYWDQISITVTESREATIAVIDLEPVFGDDKVLADTGSLFVTGTAKVTPGDKFDPAIGRKLAVGRALEALGRKLIKQGNGLVKCADDNAVHSAQAREKREEAAHALANDEALEVASLALATRNAVSSGTVSTNGEIPIVKPGDRIDDTVWVGATNR